MDDNQPVSQVTLQMLNSLIDTQTRLRDAAEARWIAAREAFFELAKLIAADWIEQRQHGKGGLDAIRMEELVQEVYRRVSTLYSASKLQDSGLMEKVTKKNEELAKTVNDLSMRVDQGEKYKQELETIARKYEKLQEENERLKKQCEKLKIEPSANVNDSGFPAPSWFKEWASSGGFGKQSQLLKLIGSTGASFRQDILEKGSEFFDIDKDTGSGKDALEGLAERGLISLKTVHTGEKGRPPKMGSITHLGEAAYIFLTRELPFSSEYEAMRPYHSTEEHTLLVMQAADILESEGYEIISKGEINIPLAGDHISSPDILARMDGEEILVEVERDVHKGNKKSREQKWQNAFEAGNGKVYIFCENPRIQKRLVQEINHALASERRLERASTFFTNMVDLEAGLRHEDGSIWLTQKKPTKSR